MSVVLSVHAVRCALLQDAMAHSRANCVMSASGDRTKRRVPRNLSWVVRHLGFWWEAKGHG